MALILKIPRRLESPNTWNGRHWRAKHRMSQEWEKEIWCSTANVGVLDLRGPVRYGVPCGPWKVRVTIERHVPNQRNFIRDDDNLRFAVKPLLDALKRQGYIKNDSRKWLEHPTPTQHVSEDGKDWTVVKIEPAEATGV